MKYKQLKKKGPPPPPHPNPFLSTTPVKKLKPVTTKTMDCNNACLKLHKNDGPKNIFFRMHRNLLVHLIQARFQRLNQLISTV